jgi:hypothetical protein
MQKKRQPPLIAALLSFFSGLMTARYPRPVGYRQPCYNSKLLKIKV